MICIFPMGTKVSFVSWSNILVKVILSLFLISWSRSKAWNPFWGYLEFNLSATSFAHLRMKSGEILNICNPAMRAALEIGYALSRIAFLRYLSSCTKLDWSNTSGSVRNAFIRNKSFFELISLVRQEMTTYMEFSCLNSYGKYREIYYLDHEINHSSQILIIWLKEFGDSKEECLCFCFIEDFTLIDEIYQFCEYLSTFFVMNLRLIETTWFLENCWFL